jgi:hypothetical protein
LIGVIIFIKKIDFLINILHKTIHYVLYYDRMYGYRIK